MTVVVATLRGFIDLGVLFCNPHSNLAVVMNSGRIRENIISGIYVVCFGEEHVYMLVCVCYAYTHDACEAH